MPKHRIKIAHFLGSRIENLSGGDLVILNLLKRLDADKFDPWIVCFNEERNPGPPLIIRTAQLRGIKTFMINTKGRFDFGAVKSLRKFILENEIDVLHCHGYKADVVGFLASRHTRVKRVATLHGWWVGRNLKTNFYNWLDHLVIKNYDKVITVSEPMKESLEGKGVPKAKLLCIPNGIDMPEANREEGNRIREEIGLPIGKIVLGTVGRLSKEKGHEYLISAIKDIDNVILLIVGNGPLETKLTGLAIKLKIEDKVVFAGFKPNIYDYISMMDIFVLPSLTEGLPLALLEAMASKKPVIASEVGGIPTVIKDGETGVFIKPKDTVSLKEAIIRLIRDRGLAGKIGFNAKEFVERNFSLEKMAENYEKVYLEVTA